MTPRRPRAIAAGIAAHIIADQHLRAMQNNDKVLDEIAGEADIAIYEDASRRILLMPPSGEMRGNAQLAAYALGAPYTPEGEPPDRLSVEPDSPHHDATILRLIRVWFKGVERFNVVEYCVSERWVRLQPKDGKGRPRFERGKWVTVKLQGDVEVKFKEPGNGD